MRNILLLTLCFLLILSSEKIFGQTDTTSRNYYKYPNEFFVVAGLSYQKQFAGEIGAGYELIEPQGCFPVLQSNLKLASEFNFNSKKFFVAPKFGVELNLVFLALRLNIIDYSNFTYHDLKLTPEVGLTFLGGINLLYGYNIPLTGNRIENIATHKFTLVFNLYPDMGDD